MSQGDTARGMRVGIWQVAAAGGLRGIANAFFNNTWISWLRDLVPQEVLGRFFSSRQAAATLAAAVVGLSAAFYIDLWRSQVPAENLLDHV